MCLKEPVDYEGSISNDTDNNVNREECNLENRDVEMTVECTSGNSDGITGLPKDILSDGSKDKMVLFWFLLVKSNIWQ